MVTPLPYDLTYEQLLDRKLQTISNEYNKRQGDIIYTAVAPNSLEVIQMLATLNVFRDTTFADTAPREELILIAAERGLTPLPATNAILRAVFNIDVPIGSRFSLQDVNYEVIERISLGQFRVRAETPGTIGNNYLGQLIPVGDITGLTSAQLVELLIPGQDEEETEAFRQRYRDSFEASVFGGNRADYKARVNALPGVGGTRVYRTPNGPGTVGITIIDSQYKAPSNTLIQEVQEAIDPIGEQGEGLGIAPINHIVTVNGVTEFPIDVALNLTYGPGFTFDIVKTQIEATINEYFTSLGEEWASATTKQEDETPITVRISQIEFRVLSVPGVLDIANTTINGVAGNIALTVSQIPSLGVVTG